MSITASERLRQFIDMIETRLADRDDINADIKAIFAEAKAEGFDTKMMRAVIRRRAMEPQALREADEILETYEAALGCGAFAGEEQEMILCDDGIHRPVAEVQLLELLTRGPEIWPPDADGQHLADAVEMIEALMDQRAHINGRIRLALKAHEEIGFSAKGIRTIIAQRAMDPDKRIAAEAIVAAYRHVMGIEGPTGRVMLPPPPASLPDAPRQKKMTQRERQMQEALGWAGADIVKSRSGAFH